MIEAWILEEETRSEIPSKAIIALQKRINTLARKRSRLQGDADYADRKRDLEGMEALRSCRDKLAKAEIPPLYERYHVLADDRSFQEIFSWSPAERKALERLHVFGGRDGTIQAIDAALAKLKPEDLEPVVRAYDVEIANIDKEIEACRARIRALGGALADSDCNAATGP